MIYRVELDPLQAYAAPLRYQQSPDRQIVFPINVWQLASRIREAAFVVSQRCGRDGEL